MCQFLRNRILYWRGQGLTVFFSSTGSSDRLLGIYHSSTVKNTSTLLLSTDADTLFVGAQDALLSLDVSQPDSITLKDKVRKIPPSGILCYIFQISTFLTSAMKITLDLEGRLHTAKNCTFLQLEWAASPQNMKTCTVASRTVCRLPFLTSSRNFKLPLLYAWVNGKFSS